MSAIESLRMKVLRDRFNPLYLFAAHFPKRYACSFLKRKQVQQLSQEFTKRGYVFSPECYTLPYFKNDVKIKSIKGQNEQSNK